MYEMYVSVADCQKNMFEHSLYSQHDLVLLSEHIYTGSGDKGSTVHVR